MRWEDCVKRNFERMGGELRTTAKDRMSEERKTNTKLMVTMANLTLDERDAKRTTL